MHHEEEERYHEHHERARRRHPRHQDEQQNFRNRWEEPRPFRDDRDRFHREDEMRARAQHEGRDHGQQHGRPRPEDISRHQHGFSDDHPHHRIQEGQRAWREGNEYYSPENQHARDRWQQHEQLPPLREQRRRHQSRRDEDWDERGW